MVGPTFTRWSITASPAASTRSSAAQMALEPLLAQGQIPQLLTDGTVVARGTGGSVGGCFGRGPGGGGGGRFDIHGAQDTLNIAKNIGKFIGELIGNQ